MSEELNRASNLVQQGRFQEAAEICRSLLEQNPAHIGAWYGAGYCYYKLGRLKQSQAILKKAAEMGHKDAALLLAKVAAKMASQPATQSMAELGSQSPEAPPAPATPPPLGYPQPVQPTPPPPLPQYPAVQPAPPPPFPQQAVQGAPAVPPAAEEKRRKKPGWFELRPPRCPECRSRHTIWLYEGWRAAFKIFTVPLNVFFALTASLWMMGTFLLATIVGIPIGIILIVLACPLSLISFALMIFLRTTMKFTVPVECQDCGYRPNRA